MSGTPRRGVRRASDHRVRRAAGAVVLVLLGLAALAAACGGATDGAGGGDGGARPDGGGVHFGDTARTDLAKTDAGAGPETTGRPDSGPAGCTSDQDCPAGLPRCYPATGQCVECLDGGDCGAGQTCNTQRCTGGTNSCDFPGARQCQGDTIVVCGADGRVEDRIDCRPNVCLAGLCVLCRPNELSCRDGAVVRCNEDAGGYTIVDPCTAEGNCVNGRCAACTPGAGRCEDGKAYRCEADGSAWTQQQDCDEYGFDCVQGACLNPCSTDPKTQTNAGCDFYALDLDNAYVVSGGRLYDAQNAQFAVVVGNTSAEKSAKVTVTLPDETTIVRDVAARGLQTFALPSRWSLDGTVRNRWAYRIQSTRPVTVYQFNPLSNEDVFSNDASVLLPTPSLGTEYYVATLPAGTPFPAYFAIVAVEAGTTEVTVRPTVGTAAGTGVPAMTAGVAHGLVLERGDVVNIEATTNGADLSGTRITASQRIAVFAGHEAAVTGDQCCADHLEEQLLPVNRWGTSYVATRSMRRSREKDYWMVMSATDANPITVAPMVAGAPAVLNAGQFARFSSDQDFLISARDPILVVQFLASSFEILGNLPVTCSSAAQCPTGYNCWGSCEPPSCSSTAGCPAGHTCASYGVCEPIGDPAMILAVPTEQFRKEFVFLTPDSYLEDYANVVAPTGTTVRLDGSPLAAGGFTPVGSSGYSVQRVRLSDGVHVLSADQPVGLTVYGYDDDVSYGYPGGLGLEDLQQPQ